MVKRKQRLMASERHPESSGFDLRSIDLNLLVIFEAIHRAGNISQAARQLGISQPTASNALGRLRVQFRDQLFVRSDRGVAATPFADGLILPVRDALGTLRGGLQKQGEFDPATASATLRIAVLGLAIPTVLPPILRELDACGSDVRIIVQPENWESSARDLQSGLLDLTLDLFPTHEDGLTYDPMPAMELVVIARRGHPMLTEGLTPAVYRQLSHLTLPQSPKVRQWVAHELLTAGVTRRETCEVPNSSDLVPVVSMTDRVATVPRRFAEALRRNHDVDIHPLPFEFGATRLFIGWKSDRSADPALIWFKSRLAEIVRTA